MIAYKRRRRKVRHWLWQSFLCSLGLHRWQPNEVLDTQSVPVWFHVLVCPRCYRARVNEEPTP